MSDGGDDWRWVGSISVTGGWPITVDGARNLLTYSRESNERLIGVFGQEDAIREWAEGNGYQLVGHCRDVSVSGLSVVGSRPGLTAAIEAVEAGRVAGIVVHRLDRLARNFEIQDDAVRRVWAAGGRVFSTDYGEWRPDRVGEPQWRLRRDYARMAEDELLALLARLQEARRRKIARGGYGGGSRYARRYGVELVSIQGRLDYRPIPAEQAVIRRIRAGCSDGRGYAAMARALNAEGVPTVSGVAWDRKVVRDLARRGPDRLVAVEDAPRSVPAIVWRREAAG